jgi:hypothetical protein
MAVWVDARRVDAIATHIEKWHETRDVAASRSARRAHAAKFTWEACADGLVGLYADALGTPR